MTNPNPTMWGGEGVVTETQPMRDAARAAMPQAEVVAVPAGDKPVTVPAAATAVTATVWEPLLIAMARGVGVAFVVGGLSLFSMLAMVPDASGRDAFVVFGTTFFSTIAAAFGIGTVDQQTAKREG